MSTLTIPTICRLFESRGARLFEDAPLSHTQHALQTAWLAEKAGARHELVCACLLHDLGHLLLEGMPDSADAHGLHAARALDGLFGVAVTDPIGLHVDAKRYLCYGRAGYAQLLSAEAKASLERQGGAFSFGQARAFMREPYALDAVNLRMWDDQARGTRFATPSLEHFAAVMHACALPQHALASQAAGG
ncbi:MAG: phosphohydrolase [Burkholderiales bacterium]|nr:phosphohydrolase [Burkholderiales bacterium]